MPPEPSAKVANLERRDEGMGFPQGVFSYSPPISVTIFEEMVLISSLVRISARVEDSNDRRIRMCAIVGYDGRSFFKNPLDDLRSHFSRCFHQQVLRSTLFGHKANWQKGLQHPTFPMGIFGGCAFPN